MPDRTSLLDELRTQYEAARQSATDHSNVEGFRDIDARMHKAFRWLEKAVTYLDGLKPAVDHRFDLGHGLVFESPRFGHGSVGQHERRIVGYPVLDEINIYYEISASKPLSLDVAPGSAALAEKALDDAGLQYASRRVEDSKATCASVRFRCHPRYRRQSRFGSTTKPALSGCCSSTSTASIASRWNFTAMRSRNRSSKISCA